MGAGARSVGGCVQHGTNKLWRLASWPRPMLLCAGAGVAVLAVGILALSFNDRPSAKVRDAEVSSQSKRPANRYRPTEAEWANLVVEPVEARSFRPEQTTEGKI